MADRKLFNKFPILRFDNIVLRQIHSNDCNELFDIYSDFENAKFITSKIHNDILETREMIDRLWQEYESGYSIYWSITISGIDKLIGFVAIHKIDCERNTARIAYLLNKRYWGKGIAYKAVKRVTEFILSETPIKRIEATIKLKNISSIRCIENAGYKLEKKISDYVSDRNTDMDTERLFYVMEL